MSRISAIDRNHAEENVGRTFDAIQKKLGMVPNMMRTMAHSPAVLEGYLALSGALSRGRLPATVLVCAYRARPQRRIVRRSTHREPGGPGNRREGERRTPIRGGRPPTPRRRQRSGVRAGPGCWFLGGGNRRGHRARRVECPHELLQSGRRHRDRLSAGDGRTAGVVRRSSSPSARPGIRIPRSRSRTSNSGCKENGP
jgi:hypothetical protein